MYRGLFLADIHIGALTYEQTLDGIIYLKKELEKLAPLDFIVVGGDYFDRQLYANDPYIKLAQKLMVYFLRTAKTVRVIAGTSSHDSDQFGIFDTLREDLPLLMDGCDYNLRIIGKVCEEELFPDLHVLYVPEEYIKYKEEYYKTYFSKENYYDYIFGHGMLQEAFTMLKREKQVKKRRSAPKFSSAELAYCCKGDVLFGHYHIHEEYMDGKVSYVGSTFRWKQGEDKDKGMYLLTTDGDSHQKEFLINPTALKYKTLFFGRKSEIYQEGVDWEEEAKKILKQKLLQNIYELRLIFHLPEAMEHPETFIRYWRSRMRKESHVHVEIGSVELQAPVEEEEDSIEAQTAEILMNPELSVEAKISYFIETYRGVKLSEERIRKLLQAVDKKEEGS